MSLFKPKHTWLATGSKQGFKYDMLLPIKGCRIVAFPDKSEFNLWQEKVDKLNEYGFDISVNDWIEKQSNLPNGTDLADVLIDLFDGID